jgi:hypothetical protein
MPESTFNVIGGAPQDPEVGAADAPDTAGTTGEDAPSAPVEPKPGPPGAPDYDWAPHYDTDDLYTHTFADGTVVVIKSFGTIYSKTFLYKARNLPTDTDIEFAAIDRASCPAAREVLGALDDTVGDPLDELWKAWVAAGTAHGEGDPGLTPGKSSG